MTLTTLADIRELVERHLPAECRERDTWQHVEAQINAAARGGDINGAVIALNWFCSSKGCRACRRNEVSLGSRARGLSESGSPQRLLVYARTLAARKFSIDHNRWKASNA